MSIWSRYFTDTVMVHKYTGTNEYGDAVFEPPLSERGVIMKCRIEHKLQEVLDKDGNRVISEAILFTNDFIPSLSVVLDSLNRHLTVKVCKPIKNLNGELDHYEVIV